MLPLQARLKFHSAALWKIHTGIAISPYQSLTDIAMELAMTQDASSFKDYLIVRRISSAFHEIGFKHLWYKLQVKLGTSCPQQSLWI